MLPALATAAAIAEEVGAIAGAAQIIIKAMPEIKSGMIIVKNDLVIISHEINQDFMKVIQFVHEKL